jgi:hypothetical protein
MAFFTNDTLLGIHARECQAGTFIPTQHQIHTLNGVTRRTFAEIIQSRHHHQITSIIRERKTNVSVIVPATTRGSGRR